MKSLYPNDIFSDWTTEDTTLETNVSTFFTDSYNSTSYNLENTTDYLDIVENNTYDSLRARNSVWSIDQNAINIDDDYPHVNYNDYGFLDIDNDTDDFFQNATGSPNLTTERVNLVVTDDPNKNASIYDSCREFGKIVKCYERICENKSLVFDNFSGIYES